MIREVPNLNFLVKTDEYRISPPRRGHSTDRKKNLIENFLDNQFNLGEIWYFILRGYSSFCLEGRMVVENVLPVQRFSLFDAMQEWEKDHQNTGFKGRKNELNDELRKKWRTSPVMEIDDMIRNYYRKERN